MRSPDCTTDREIADWLAVQPERRRPWRKPL